MTLRTDFADDFARSAFRVIDGETNIVGKFGRITQFPDGSYDCWFVGPDLAPLTARRLTVIRKKINGKWPFRELTGEAYTQGAGRAFVLEMADLIRVRKRVRVSAATRDKLRANAARARAARMGGGRQ